MSEEPRMNDREGTAAASRAADELAEQLTALCRAAMAKAGFQPSDALLDKFQQEIRYALHC